MCLRRLGIGARLGVACCVLVLLGGLLASGAHVFYHHSKKDDVKGLSMDDVMGAYHGITAPARLPAVLEAGHGDTLKPNEREALLAWLLGPRDASGKRAGAKRITEDFDNLDSGEMAPNEIIGRSCLQCHGRKAADSNPIAKTVPLDYRDDVLRLAFPKNLTPVSDEIRVASLHAHSIALGTMTLAVIGLLLATRMPRLVVGGLIFLMGAGLLTDLGGQWIARSSEIGVHMLLGGGAAFAVGSGLSLLLVLADLCMPRIREGE